MNTFVWKISKGKDEDMIMTDKELIFNATLDELPTICQTITEAARECGMDDKNVWKLEVSLDEACTNIACYGYKDTPGGKIWIRWYCEDGNFVLKIEDAGVAFDQTKPTKPDFEKRLCDRKPGGLGRYIMREFMDQLDYKRENDHNIITLVKKLHCESTNVA